MRSGPSNLGFRGWEIMFTPHLEDVEFASFVAVGDLLLKLLRVARVESDLLPCGRCGAHVGHGHQAHLVELVDFIGQIRQGVPFVADV